MLLYDIVKTPFKILIKIQINEIDTDMQFNFLSKTQRQIIALFVHSPMK